MGAQVGCQTGRERPFCHSAFTRPRKLKRPGSRCTCSVGSCRLSGTTRKTREGHRPRTDRISHTSKRRSCCSALYSLRKPLGHELGFGHFNESSQTPLNCIHPPAPKAWTPRTKDPQLQEPAFSPSLQL